MSEQNAKKKWLERSLMAIAAIGTIVVILLYGDVIERMVNPPIPKSTVYGKWVEQDVASYVREEFIISEQGISINGAIVATDFELDSSSFSYRFGNETRTFDFIGQSFVEMRLSSDAHYLPVFELEGKQDLSLR